jgi:hypothetical protein
MGTNSQFVVKKIVTVAAISLEPHLKDQNVQRLRMRILDGHQKQLWCLSCAPMEAASG